MDRDEHWNWLDLGNKEQCQWFVKYRSKKFPVQITLYSNQIDDQAREYKRYLIDNITTHDLTTLLRDAKSAWRKQKSLNGLKKRKKTTKQFTLPDATIRELNDLAKESKLTDQELIIALIGGSFDQQMQRKHEEHLEKVQQRTIRTRKENTHRFQKLLDRYPLTEQLKDRIKKLEEDQIEKHIEVEKLHEQIAHLESQLEESEAEVRKLSRQLNIRRKYRPMRIKADE